MLWFSLKLLDCIKPLQNHKTIFTKIPRFLQNYLSVSLRMPKHPEISINLLPCFLYHCIKSGEPLRGITQTSCAELSKLCAGLARSPPSVSLVTGPEFTRAGQLGRHNAHRCAAFAACSLWRHANTRPSFVHWNAAVCTAEASVQVGGGGATLFVLYAADPRTAPGL